ncbi:protein kinase domain-containing protein [Pseudothauera rhizosphaerae]|uniref:non-specific serine/threonine protein kinase n=1 Tax=Pseudothauera rhizosphaerae TaxID=2565932 RepID=A0A4S4ANG7_9RHOO|nr:protein kinase [Pseudothauera rhizosphaerae]THF61174.1 HAMP domain-containing protein [Pseudothauera rhizosphaerae]
MSVTLGRYILRGELGSGATSIIHRGYDPRIRRILAIKTLRPEYAEREEYRYRFLSEARAAGTLTHPGIVTIFDVGVVNGVPFITMELLEGPTLASFVERHGRLPLRMILRIVTQIADALDYAHRQGVVHQDIKPENIVVTSESGNVKVMDFGIARLRHKAERDNATDGVAGTPHYMSPEQIRGGAVDGRTDLYALGVLLYWLLAGHTPFRTNNVPDLLRKVLKEPLPPLKPLDPATPEALLDLVRTLLAKDPAERYQTAAELIEDLRRIDDALAERETAWHGRRIIPIRVRWTALMGMLVAVTVALGMAVVYYKQNQAMTRVAFDFGLTLTRTLATESAEDLLLDDRIAIQALVDEMVLNREIVYIAVSDRSGRIVASTDEALLGADGGDLPTGRHLLSRDDQAVYEVADAEGHSYFLFDTPVQYQAHELGHLRVGLATNAVQAANRTTLAAMVAVMLVILVTVFIGAYMLSRRLAVPLEILRRALGHIAQGRFGSRIRMRRNDEFERLFAAYNSMADSLEARMFVAHSARRNAAVPSGKPAEPATRMVETETRLARKAGPATRR